MSDPQQPIPLGYSYAATEVRTIAAPLYTAAALSLAGVVAAASKDTFRWPGATLLLLVATSLMLVASLQLHYYARQYLYSRADIDAWFPHGVSKQTEIYKKLCIWQGNDYKKWAKFNNSGIHFFNLGTVLLGFGVALALIPPDGGRQESWRWAAAILVLVCAVADLVWVLVQYRGSGKLQRARRTELAKIPWKP
ncbi:hypothetical protein [Actinomadura sp. B10D3]|uniref:hypothetical protein n=1 Tax=Actinomadura sp. B10D3 TaxID=3153557 RepID=UPI00325EB223